MEDFETTSVGGSSIRSSQATTDSSMTEKIKLDMEDKSDEFNDRVNEKDEAKQKILIADQLLMQRGLTPPAHVKEELHHTNNADSTTAAESAENEDPKTKSQQASDVIKPYVAVEFNHLPGELPQENNDDETDESFALMKDESATNGYVPVQQIADYLVYNERFEVDPRQIKKERRIGEGFYGDVYLGTLSRSKENIQVAIKMAKDEKSVLRDEMKILMYLQSTARPKLGRKVSVETREWYDHDERFTLVRLADREGNAISRREEKCWSFGVVIWELFTFAKQLPYETELENFGKSINSWQSLVVYLSKGHRLTLPSIVPSDIRTIVTELWNEDPVKRPNFLECRRTIRRVLQQACENIVLDESVSSLNIAETAEFHTEEEVLC
uniref:Protein kinase domain-containing protein n=1 Tax=Plectus sambesii TaxID=2011161 RepID=A0A914X5E3_9BILA